MTFRVLPYRAGSRGASALAAALPGARVLRLRGSAWRTRPNDIVINWGNTTCQDHPAYRRDTVLNKVNDILIASNKRTFFNTMRNNRLEDIIPQFWTNRQDIPDDAFPIVCRTVLAGHSGDGIVIADTRADLVPAPLYTQYVKKTQEYRIHVGRNSRGQSIIISSQRKARSRAIPDGDVNWQVRNHQNGFIYTREGFVVPDSVLEAAQRCFMATGLDFAAMDVILNERSGRAFVLEANTAPGLEGQTVQDYVRFFQNL